MANTMLSNLAAITQNTQSSNIRMIDIDELHSSPDNFFEVRDIPEFAATILGQGGVKDNLLVTPLESGGYEIISGHRRTAAVRYLIEHGESISRLLPCLVQSYDNDDDKQLDIILLNIATRQISDQEMWHSYEKLDQKLKARKEAGEKFGKIRDRLAEMLNVSRAQISKMKNVTNNAIEPVKEAIANGDLSIHSANEIAKLPKAQQEELAAGDLRKIQPKDVKKKKTAFENTVKKSATSSPHPIKSDTQEEESTTSSTFPVGFDVQEEESTTSSTFSIMLDEKETTLLSETLSSYLSDCNEDDRVKDALREIIQKLDAIKCR